MISLLIRMLLRLLLLPQFCLWVLVSSVLDLAAATADRLLKSIDRLFIQPALDILLWLGDWIDWCIEPAVIVFDTWKEISSVLLDCASRPARFGLLLWADCVDLCLQPFLSIVHFFVSPVRSTFEALVSPFKGLLPFEVETILPAQALEQLQDSGFLNDEEEEEEEEGEEREKGSGTMTSMVTGGPMTRKLGKLGLSTTETGKEHKRVEDYTASIVSALCQSLFEYLADEEGATALGEVIEHYAAATQTALSEEPLTPSYTIGGMMLVGAYDGAGEKASELKAKLPAAVKGCLFPVLACYAALFCSGLFFSLLRFAIYGLH